jgi:hypothetical protein
MGERKVVVRRVVPNRGNGATEHQRKQVVHVEAGDACEQHRFIDQEAHQAHGFEDEKAPTPSAATTISPSDQGVEGECDENRQLNRYTGRELQGEVEVVVEDHRAHEGRN